MLIATVSSKGSPGASVSALALTLTWPRPAILVELDPAGGDVQFGYGRGQNVGAAGLVRLQVATRTAKPVSSLVWNEVVELPHDGDGPVKWWLPGLTDPQQANSLNWAAIGRALRAVDGEVDVIADCGSVSGDRDRAPRAVWAVADLVALAVRPTLAGVHIARGAATVLRMDLMAGGLGADRLSSIVVDTRHGYPLRDVAKEMADLAPVLDRSLPYDPTAADTLTGARDQSRRFPRSALMRAAAQLATVIGGRAIDLGATVATPAAIRKDPGAAGQAVRIDESVVPAAPPVGVPRSVVPEIPERAQVPDRGAVREAPRRPIPIPNEVETDKAST